MNNENNNIKKCLSMLAVLLVLNIKYVKCATDCNSTKPAPIARLMKDLLRDYDKRVRPSCPTNVDVKFSPYYFTIDEEWDFLNIAGEVQMTWKDESLTWNVSNYTINNVRSSNLDIWTPEIITLDEGLAGFFKHQQSFVKKFFVVANNGIVKLDAQVILTGPCRMYIHYWPHMRATCDITLGPFGNDPDVKYNNFLDNMSLQNVKNDTAWQLKSFNSDYEKCLKKNNQDCILSLNVEMVKYAKLYSSPIIAPALVLSVLTLVPFWIQYNMLHRLMLSLFVFFVQLIFLAVLGFHLEDNISESIVIVTFYKYCLLFSTISIITTLLERYMLLQSEQPPTIIMNTIIRLLPRLQRSTFFWIIFVGNNEEDSERFINDDEKMSHVGKKKEVIQEWEILACFFSRILFVVLLVPTVIFWFTLIP